MPLVRDAPELEALRRAGVANGGAVGGGSLASVVERDGAAGPVAVGEEFE